MSLRARLLSLRLGATLLASAVTFALAWLSIAVLTEGPEVRMPRSLVLTWGVWLPAVVALLDTAWRRR